jgi:uncharacterized membrane protein
MVVVLMALGLFPSPGHAAFKLPLLGGGATILTPLGGTVTLPLKDVGDGKAHYYKVKADDGIMVTFFVVKSRDGVVRAAFDACDVCYKAGKGYVQEGNLMVCENCGMKFATERINEVKGGCNPAPLNRAIQGENLVIQMRDLNAGSWYCKYKKQ